VVAVAALGNRAAGALAAVGAAVWFDFFFTVPYERFTIRSAADVTTFILLLVVGVAVSQLAAYARRLKVIAITDAGYMAQIQEAAALAQSGRSRMRSPSRSGSSWRACWGWNRPGSSSGRC
jgi:K+-sensing histidine kinase KdpD